MLLEDQSGSEVEFNLETPEAYPGKLAEVSKFLENVQDALPVEQDKFTFTKHGSQVLLSAQHVYNRFINGERWNRAGVGGEPKSNEDLKELHERLQDKTKFKGEPGRRGRPKKEVDPNAPRPEPKPKREPKPRAAKKAGSPRKGPQPVESTDDSATGASDED
jgi:hypothetical protein